MPERRGTDLQVQDCRVTSNSLPEEGHSRHLSTVPSSMQSGSKLSTLMGSPRARRSSTSSQTASKRPARHEDDERDGRSPRKIVSARASTIGTASLVDVTIDASGSGHSRILLPGAHPSNPTVAPYEDYGVLSYGKPDQYPCYPRRQYTGHVCSADCKFEESKDTLAAYIKLGHNPLVLPLLFGWYREVKFLKVGRSPVAQNLIQYVAPCGRAMKSIKKLQEHLLLVGSMFPITLFTFEATVDIFRKFIVSKPHVKLFKEDIAKKILEKPYARIPVVNCFTKDEPSPFSYVKKNSKSEDTKRAMRLLNIEDRVVGCTCVGHCGTGCLCSQMMTDTADGDGQLEYGRLRNKQRFLVECNDSCPCGPNCANRTTTNTIPFPLIMYYYPDKGYGVRALCDIPAGSFIAFYHGQIVTERESEQSAKNNDKYLVALDFATNSQLTEPESSDSADSTSGGEEQDSFLLDGRRFGNVSRFFNHSCEPNMFTQVVHRESFSGKIYNVAFFTHENVKAGDELTWNYGYVIGSVPNRVIECFCRASSCKIRML